MSIAETRKVRTGRAAAHHAEMRAASTSAGTAGIDLHPPAGAAFDSGEVGPHIVFCAASQPLANFPRQ